MLDKATKQLKTRNRSRNLVIRRGKKRQACIEDTSRRKAGKAEDSPIRSSGIGRGN